MADIEEIVQNIRACIVSNKGGIPLRNLARDYETLCCDQIPYRKHNYASLEDFLRSLPSLRVCGSGGQAMVEAATIGASKHITDLISKQKSVKKPASRGYPTSGYRGRGTRGRGRGGYPTRGYHNASNSYATRYYPSRDPSSRDYSSRDPSSRDYSSRDQSSRDYSSRDQSSRDYSSRDHNSKDYSARDQSYRNNSTKDQTSRELSPKNSYNKDNRVKKQSTIDVAEDTWDDNDTSKASPPSEKRQTTSQSGASFMVKVDGDNRKVTWSNNRKNELPPRFQKLRTALKEALSPEPPSSPPAPEMVCKIHLIGSLQAKHLKEHLSGCAQSKIIVSQFLECSGLKIKDIKTKIMMNKPNWDSKVPLLIMIGEIDVMKTTEKIKEIKKDYIALIFFLREIYPGIKVILIDIPLCICTYHNENHLVRAKSFNDFLSNGLEFNADGIFVLSLIKVLDKMEFFCCFDKKIKAKDNSHLTEIGYASIAKSLITLLQQAFDSSLFLGQTDSATESASIISPLGPSQLIAAGRAKQQAEKAQHQKMSMSTNLLLQSPTTLSNGLDANFARLSHQDSPSSLLDQSSHISENGQVTLPVAGGELDSQLLVADERCLSNNIAQLQSYCAIRGWQEPLYTVTNPTARIGFLATVKVFREGDNPVKVSSFPFDHKDVNIVKGFAAKKALDIILVEESKKVKHDVVVSSDKNLYLNRICEIVAEATHGKFEKSVEKEYMVRHNEMLPQDWLKNAGAWPWLAVESTALSTIILPRQPQSFEFKTVAPPPLPVDSLGNNPDQAEDVFITHATSVNSVYFRVIGKEYSDEYELLLQKMDEYYNGVGKQDLALMLEVGHYYAACKSDTWFRVCVTEVDQVGMSVLAWLLDLGDTDCFPFGSLYRLAPQFCQLPQQAVLCTLEGLEAFSEDPVASKIVTDSEMLIGQTLIAKISHKDIEYSYVMVSLYDTSGDDDVNVNLQLKDEIIAENKPALPAANCAMEVGIGHVSKEGEVFITFIGPALERILEILDSLPLDKISEQKLTSFKHISLNKYYLAKYSLDDKWYRVIVTKTPSVQQNKIPVRFVDFGNTEVVSINCLADLETFPPILRKLAPQAMKVALHNLPLSSLTNAEVARLHSLLLAEDKAVLIKTVSLQEDPPVVEIFTKDADRDNAALESVNSAIQLYRKSYRAQHHNGSVSNENNKLIKDILRTMGGLKHPEFDLFETLDLCVVLPAHPGHFTFQLGKYYEELQKLKPQMEAYYNADTVPELDPNNVQKNQLYAARYHDDNWYRVLVTDIEAGNRVIIRLVDFGDVVCFSISRLRELPFVFRDCPFMAIQGRLANVKPANDKDWTVEDCIRFRELCSGVLMSGTVTKVEEDRDSPMGYSVSLILIDKDSGNDQNIADVLLAEKRAVKVEQ